MGAKASRRLSLFSIELLFAQRITQIYRIMVAWLDNLSDMYSVKFLLYSDNYHLGEYAENPERVSLLCHGACGSDWEVRQQG